MKRNALMVGGFVVIAGVLVVVTILWMSGSSLFRQEVRAVMYFQESVRGLYIGAPVTFRGVPVGQVDQIGIEVDSTSLHARIPVRVRLRPYSLRVINTAGDRLDLPTLVQRGLRARLVAQSFVTGQKLIDLDFVPDTVAVLVGSSDEPEIPTLADRFGALIDQVADLPLRETVQDLRGTLQAMQRTLNSTQETIAVLGVEVKGTAAEARKTLGTATSALLQVQASANATLASVTQLSQDTRHAILTAQPELQRAVVGARDAAEAARIAMNRVAEITSAGSALRGDLEAAVRDLSQAARGLREWSELLEEKPNAIIFGTSRQ
jgi:paraquat-inducible protein B